MNNKAEDQAVNAENADNSTARRKLGTGKTVLIIMLLFFGMIYLTQRDAVSTIDCTPDIIATKPDVIMLGAWWCRYCHQAKRYFQENSIHYCEYDMETTATGKRLYQEHGAGAVPILLIGKYQLSGFNSQQIETALDRLKNGQNIN